jgi:hypothetical protein
MAHAQSGYQIRIKTENITADSLFVKSYQVKSKKFTPFLALKFENDMTIMNKMPLNTGIYVVEADSVILTEFLISDDKNQKFTFSFLKDDIIVEGSKENSANRAYMKKMFDFNRQLIALDDDFRQMQQKGLPQYMMQTYVDSLTAQFDRINTEKNVYQQQIIKENKGLLLASIIQSSFEPPPPPREYLRDRVKYYSFLSDNLFHNFPWEDERLLNTPVLYNKFKTFCQQIFHLEPEFSIPIVLKVLNDSKKNSNMFYALFDYLEHEFGTHKSPYRDESLYIAMLKEILNTPDVEETRTLRYEYELKIIDKNHAGAQAPDFNILFANGDTTTMYNIDAELLMLYFQNPDCPTCGDIREKMKNMDIVNQAIAAGKLKIVTVYFEPNEKLWRNYLNTRALKNWEHGWNYDFAIPEKHLYDTRTIPMVMFLDKNKKIIKKDILWNDIEEWLKRHL